MEERAAEKLAEHSDDELNNSIFIRSCNFRIILCGKLRQIFRNIEKPLHVLNVLVKFRSNFIGFYFKRVRGGKSHKHWAEIKAK